MLRFILILFQRSIFNKTRRKCSVKNVPKGVFRGCPDFCVFKHLVFSGLCGCCPDFFLDVFLVCSF